MTGIVINNAANTINNTTVVATELSVTVDPGLNVPVLTLNSGFYWSGTCSLIYSDGSNFGSWLIAVDLLNNASTSNIANVWDINAGAFDINTNAYTITVLPVLNVTNSLFVGAGLFVGTWSDGVSAYISQGGVSPFLPISSVTVTGSSVAITCTGYSGSDTTVAFGGITNVDLTAINGAQTVTSISGDVITITLAGLTPGTYTTGLGLQGSVPSQNVEISLSGNTVVA